MGVPSRCQQTAGYIPDGRKLPPKSGLEVQRGYHEAYSVFLHEGGLDSGKGASDRWVRWEAHALAGCCTLQAKALANLAGFYDMCAQVEIDDYREYDKVCGYFAVRKGFRVLFIHIHRFSFVCRHCRLCEKREIACSSRMPRIRHQDATSWIIASS